MSLKIKTVFGVLPYIEYRTKANRSTADTHMFFVIIPDWMQPHIEVHEAQHVKQNYVITLMSVLLAFATVPFVGSWWSLALVALFSIVMNNYKPIVARREASAYAVAAHHQDGVPEDRITEAAIRLCSKVYDLGMNFEEARTLVKRYYDHPRLF